MRSRVWGISLFIAFVAAGCASSQVHQSLLMQENRRLEDALYVAHAQVGELKRENDFLRNKQETGSIGPLEDEFDMDAPFEIPKVMLPGQSGTEEVPESLRGSQVMPTWRPRR